MKLPIFVLPFVFLSACSSSEPPPTTPAWIQSPARDIDGGYIVYVGSGEATTDELAKFKAEAIALQDLANECSFVPKGTRVEDRYSRAEGGHFVGFAKVGLDFESCEKAKRTLDPDEVRNFANEPFTQEIKRYQDMIGEDSKTTEAQLAANQAPNSAADTPAPTEVAETSTAPRTVVIHDTPEFFWVRQRIVYAKQDVILAPRTTYVASSPQTETYMTSVRNSSEQVQNFATAHPETTKTAQSWSTVQRQVRMQSSHLSEAKSHSAPKARPTEKKPRTGKKGRRKRKRPQPPTF